MNFLLFLAPFSWGTQKRVASASKASGCFMGGNPMLLRAEPGKQRPRSCRTQELARSSARENEWRKKAGLTDSTRIEMRSRSTSICEAKKPSGLYAHIKRPLEAQCRASDTLG